MSPSDLSLALSTLIPNTTRPIWIWGPPGCAKSSIVKQTAAKLDMEIRDIRAALLDPVDLRGIPHTDGKTTKWAVPDFLPRKGRGVLFLDELAQGQQSVQSAFLELSLDRRIGDYRLPDEWRIVAASNRQEDRAGANRIITPLLNRFIHYDLEVSCDDFDGWALQNGVVPEVRSFIKFRPGLLFQFDASSGKRCFPSPRSWHALSDVLSFTPASLLLQTAMGCVGEGPAAEFVGFARIYHELPDIDQLLANPSSGGVPKEPGVLYALVGALVEKVRKATPKLLGAFSTYVQRLPTEFATLAMRDAAALNNTILMVPEAQNWVRKNAGILYAK